MPEVTVTANEGVESVKVANVPRASLATKSIYVRAWDHPESMADALAILRGVERQYGRIQDFKWSRVSECSCTL